ncbi:MAG: threonine-phosphate decarboxylase [Deltaproteobacteria bacterium RBG_19FT_COMBO_52_11]|nr:MAG: threonine-phosphate decarboxylase [Deltaproteobacteria bacterium RBG_19FT_COMBO_52_11]
MNQIHNRNTYEISRQFGLNLDEMVDFSASINPLGLSKKAEKKLRENLAAVLHYPDPQCSALIKTLAQFHGLGEDQILIGAGSTEFIYALPHVLKIQRPLIVTPTFREYENALERTAEGQTGGVHYFETQEEDGFELNVESLLFALTRGYDALFLCNPNNPTGIRTEKKDLRKILVQAERQKVWLILDEAFIDFTEEESMKEEAGASSRLVILRSLTTFFALPGLRVGYMISNPQVIKKFHQAKEPWRVNALAQVAAVESLKDRAYIARTKELVNRERERLIHGLRSIPGFIPYPSAANFLLVQLHPSLNMSAAGLRENLIPHGLLIRDCNSFHHIGPFFFRIAVRSRKENSVLVKILRQVCKDMP